jgi:hypothetical protein
LPVTDDGAAFSPDIQVCHPDWNEDAAEAKPAPSEAEASETAADVLASKASARVKVVDPLAATGIWPVWVMCPDEETPV